MSSKGRITTYDWAGNRTRRLRIGRFAIVAVLIAACLAAVAMSLPMRNSF